MTHVEYVTGIFSIKNMPGYLKAKIYKITMWPVAIYGAQYCVNDIHEQDYVMEMKVLLQTLGLAQFNM